jgi:hypothetical protein
MGKHNSSWLPTQGLLVVTELNLRQEKYRNIYLLFTSPPPTPPPPHHQELIKFSPNHDVKLSSECCLQVPFMFLLSHFARRLSCGFGDWRTRVRFPAKRIYLFSTEFRPALESTEPLIQWVPGLAVSFPWGKPSPSLTSVEVQVLHTSSWLVAGHTYNLLLVLEEFITIRLTMYIVIHY